MRNSNTFVSFLGTKSINGKGAADVDDDAAVAAAVVVAGLDALEISAMVQTVLQVSSLEYVSRVSRQDPKCEYVPWFLYFVRESSTRQSSFSISPLRFQSFQKASVEKHRRLIMRGGSFLSPFVSLRVLIPFSSFSLSSHHDAGITSSVLRLYY